MLLQLMADLLTEINKFYRTTDGVLIIPGMKVWIVHDFTQVISKKVYAVSQHKFYASGDWFSDPVFSTESLAHCHVEQHYQKKAQNSANLACEAAREAARKAHKETT